MKLMDIYDTAIRALHRQIAHQSQCQGCDECIRLKYVAQDATENYYREAESLTEHPNYARGPQQ